jgi:hypothetical protein
MFTLQEIVEKESRILIDTSIMPFFCYKDIKKDNENLKIINQLLNDYQNIHLIPEVYREIELNKLNTKKNIKLTKGKLNRCNAQEKHELKSLNEKLHLRQKLSKRLRDKLRGRIIDFNPLEEYQILKNIVYKFEDKLSIKTGKKHPENRTDESIIATALYFSLYGNHRTAIITNDGDLPNLLRIIVKEIRRPGLNTTLKRLSHNLTSNKGIIIYRPTKDNNQAYRIVLNTKAYHVKPELGLESLQEILAPITT